MDKKVMRKEQYSFIGYDPIFGIERETSNQIAAAYLRPRAGNGRPT